jgi:hypothetical protein
MQLNNYNIMKTFSLVHIGRSTFIMLNAKDNLTNNQCNSTIFEIKEDASLNTNIFDYFDLKVSILVDKLDRRTKNFKQLEKEYQYFSASFLPAIKKNKENNSLITKKY